MNREWIRQKLVEYRTLLEEYELQQGTEVEDDIRGELLYKEPTIREIFGGSVPT